MCGGSADHHMVNLPKVSWWICRPQPGGLAEQEFLITVAEVVTGRKRASVRDFGYGSIYGRFWWLACGTHAQLSQARSQQGRGGQCRGYQDRRTGPERDGRPIPAC